AKKDGLNENVWFDNVERVAAHRIGQETRLMIDEYLGDATFDDQNRALFAFACYNAGPNRIAQLRKDSLGLEGRTPQPRLAPDCKTALSWITSPGISGAHVSATHRSAGMAGSRPAATISIMSSTSSVGGTSKMLAGGRPAAVRRSFSATRL